MASKIFELLLAIIVCIIPIFLIFIVLDYFSKENIQARLKKQKEYKEQQTALKNQKKQWVEDYIKKHGIHPKLMGHERKRKDNPDEEDLPF